MRLFKLAIILLFSETLFAQTISSGGLITDRPSSKRLPLPEYVPDKQKPGFTLPHAPQQKSKVAPASELMFVVKGYLFSGNTVFTDQQLQLIAKPFLDRAIAVTDLEQLRQHLTQHYINHGYINSGAIIPEQKFKADIIQFQIIEGQLSEIRVSGNERLRPEYVKERLQLGAQVPLNDQDLQDQFQLLLTDQLIERMDGRLRPGLSPGESILDVNVRRAKAYALLLSVDNYRPPSTGAEEGRLDGWVRNITGLGDFMNMSLGYGKDRFDISTGITVPVNRYDTLLGFHYTNQRSSIQEKPLDALDIENKFYSYSLSLFHPLYRTLQHRVNLGARLEQRKSVNQLLGRRFSFSSGEENGESKVSVLRLSQEFIDSRVKQVFSFRSTFSIGLKMLDSTWHDDNRPDGDFLAWLGQLQYARQILDNGAQIRFRGNIQLADDKLLPLEQYAIGGVYSVRGYRENEVVRDQGYNVSIEFQYPLLSGELAEMMPGQISIIPFLDYGAAWNYSGSDKSTYLYGIGAGLVWSYQRFNTELFYAHDLNTASEKFENNLQDSSLYFRVTALLF